MHAWLGVRGFRRPVIATGRAMASIAGASYLVGGVIGLLSAFLGDGDDWVVVLALAVIVCGGALVGAAIVELHLPQALFYALTLGAIAVLAAGVHAERGRLLAMALASLLILVTIFAFAFFPWASATVVEVLVVAVLLAAAGWWHAVPPMASMAMAGQNVILAVILGWLVRAAARAETDVLTGLPDRRGFERAFPAALDRAERARRPLTVAFLELDDLPIVNAQQGPAAGDRLLLAAAEEWAQRMGPDSLLARYGGNRFALLAPATATETVALLERFPGGIAFSAGLAARRTDDDPEALVARAGAALDEARQAGGQRVFCSPDAAVDSWTEMASALAAGEFSVAYQPIVDLRSGRVTGAEALLRWDRPGAGPVPPTSFIPQAESSGFIIELGRFVLEQACREAAGWTRDAPTKIAVNVSGRELYRPDYYAQVTEVLFESGLPAGRLVLEVTESMLEADSPRALATLRRLRALGIRIAIDDFGTGYSSLGRLDRLPADILKIDRSFVTKIGAAAPDGGDAPLITAIVALAAALGLRTVAEGVEDVHQAAVLAHHGCDEGQGWLFGRPGDAAAVRNALGHRTAHLSVGGSLAPVAEES